MIGKSSETIWRKKLLKLEKIDKIKVKFPFVDKNQQRKNKLLSKRCFINQLQDKSRIGVEKF